MKGRPGASDFTPDCILLRGFEWSRKTQSVEAIDSLRTSAPTWQ